MLFVPGPRAAPVGGKQTYPEKGVRPWVGSADPIPITMYTTLIPETYKHTFADLDGGCLLVGACARRCMFGSIRLLFEYR